MNVANDNTAHVRAPARVRLERVEDMLRRYPDLTDIERDEILAFLRSAPAIERGLLNGNEALSPQLDRFRADHARLFGIRRKELAIIAALIVVVVAAVLLLWDAGK